MTPDCKIRRLAKRGFTLVEVVISMTILALGVLSTISLSRWVIQGTDFNRNTTKATLLAQDKLEDLRGTNYSQIASGSDVTQNMTRTWSYTAQAGYKEVSVTVSWTGLDQQQRSATLKSMVASP